MRSKALRQALVWVVSVLACLSTASAQGGQRIALNGAVVLVASSEPSYVQYGVRDLAGYLGEITGEKVSVLATIAREKTPKTVIAVGAAAAQSLGVKVTSTSTSSQEFVLQTVQQARGTVIVIAGAGSQGTNVAIASFMQLIRGEGRSAFLEHSIDLHEKPNFELRGIHLNGWPLNYPYAFRAWKEADWKRFVDIAWAQRINLFYLWPFMEILPVPLSNEDQAYLQEARRVVDYAKNQRGIQVWIMQSANRIGTSNCGTPDPRMRAYWVNECQKDMNPADPQQFGKIMTSFEAFYRNVNNADAYVMIDSDPGGWPQSPVSDQIKIFQGARKLLDQYSVDKSKTKLVDWMHVGWGRHKFFTSTDSVVAAYDWTDKNPDESDVAFMGGTIRDFKKGLDEPWGLIAGQPPYLPVVKDEGVLEKTVYLPYGAIESEPAFPATNLGQESVRKVFDKADQFPGLLGVMGNNQLMLLQFPRTFYFYATAWDKAYENQTERQSLLDLATQLYPEHSQLVVDAFLALRDDDVDKINAALNGVGKLLVDNNAGRPGSLGRLLFPDHRAVLSNLKMQLEIRFARQALLASLKGKPTIDECTKLMENYLDKLLAWNKETGWNRMIEITVWPRPIYEEGKDFTEGMYRLKQLLAQGAPYTSYAKVDSFFDGISKDLLKKYDQDSVMVGCIDPMKLAVLQSQ